MTTGGNKVQQHSAYFANFICRFGKSAVLLDYAKEIVLPAFLDDTLVRSHGRTHYHFYEVKLSNFGSEEEPLMALTGRFIKDTRLVSEQVFDPLVGLKKNRKSLRSSPSCFFVLTLNDHRLVYFPEVAHAPDLKAFKITAEQFILKKYKAFIDKKMEDIGRSERASARQELSERVPRPTLRVVPLTQRQKIEQFVARFEVLKRAELRLVEPNDEIDAEDLFKDFRKYFGKSDADTTKIVVANSDGLDKDAMTKIVHDATSQGNQTVRLTGVDEDGNKLVGDNEEYQVIVPVDEVPESDRRLARRLLKLLNGLIADGIVPVAHHAQDVMQKIAKLREKK